MTSVRSTVARLFGGMTAEVESGPAGDFTFAPPTPEDAARILDFASEHRLTVLPWGGGSHQGIGGRVEPAIVLSTARMGSIVDWQPDDLTVVVEGGVALSDLEATLAERDQSVMVDEIPGTGTVGGAVAAGASGWRRLRYGPVRDRVLEVLLATGDGRLVRAGGRVVKNVTGYDIQRLVTGSLGALGVVTRLCLKVWPVGEATATVTVDDAARALHVVYRPLAVLEDAGTTTVYLEGARAQVEADAATLGGEAVPGHRWPEPLRDPVVVSVRVPPASVAEAVRRLPDPQRHVAAHGVGEVRAGFDEVDPRALEELRSWAEDLTGSVVLLRGPDELYAAFDPWGTPPGDLELQRRVKAAFDPLRIMVPGRLPGGL